MGTFVVNQVLTAAECNSFAQLLAVGGAQFGSPPALGTAPFYLQAASSVIATNSSGAASITFPVAFPNGVLTVIPSVGDNSISNLLVEVVESQVTKAGCGLQVFVANTGAGLNTQTFRLNWLAIGF